MSSPSFSAMSETDFNILQGALVVMLMCPWSSIGKGLKTDSWSSHGALMTSKSSSQFFFLWFFFWLSNGLGQNGGTACSPVQCTGWFKPCLCFANNYELIGDALSESFSQPAQLLGCNRRQFVVLPMWTPTCITPNCENVLKKQQSEFEIQQRLMLHKLSSSETSQYLSVLHSSFDGLDLKMLGPFA